MATTFITRAGDRIQAEFPPSLLKPGVSQAQRERYLISQGVLPDPDAPVVEQVEPQELVQQVIDTAALSSVEARLAALEGRPLPELPSPDRVEQLIVSAMRAGVSKEEVTVVADEATARINTTAAGCEERLSTVEAREQALTEQVSSTLSEATTAVAESIASASQQLAAFQGELQTEALQAAKAVAAKQVGPQGLAGSGVTIIDADPLKTDAQSIGRMAFGRALVPGDCVLHPGEDALRFYRWNGDAWDKRAGEIVNRVIAADVKVSALDNSSKTTTNVVNQTTVISGGGGGSLPLLTRNVTSGGGTAWTTVARSWDWDIPSQYWGGHPDSPDYSEASWAPKSTETFSFHCRLIALDTTDTASMAQEAFTVGRHLTGIVDVQMYEADYEGKWAAAGVVGLVTDARIVDIQRDFTTESQLKVGIVRGKELQLNFGANGLAAPIAAMLTGSITPLTVRKAGV